MLTTSELFNLKQVAPFLQPLLTDEMPWRVLKHLDSFLESISDERFGQIHSTAWVIGSVYLDASARIGPHALIEGPAWIGPGAEVGHSAYLRGGVVMAQGSKVGHSSEVKHSILLSGAKLPHCNYVVTLSSVITLISVQVLKWQILIHLTAPLKLESRTRIYTSLEEQLAMMSPLAAMQSLHPEL